MAVVLVALLAVAQSFVIPATMTFEERLAYVLSFQDTLHSVNVTWSPLAGFGFKVLEDIPQGKCVINLPLRYAVTSADAYTLSEYTKDFGEMERLAIRVAYEKFIKKRDHFVKQYVDSVPVEPFHMTQFWNPEDKALYDKHGLVMLDYKSMDKFDTAELHGRITKALEGVPGVPKELFEPEVTEWSMGIVMSRSYHIVDENMKKAVNQPDVPHPILALFPILDVINHYPVPVREKPTQPTIFSIEPGLISKLCSLAQFSHKKGQEYFASYGDKSNYELVSMYGFAVEHNPDDTIEFGLPVSPYCTGSRHIPNRCFYTTKAHKVAMPALVDIIASLAQYQFTNPAITFQEVVDHIASMPARNPSRKTSINAVIVYRNVILMTMTHSPMRTLRREKKNCPTYRCYLIHTLLISQRVARFVHTERVDRKVLSLLAQDLDIFLPSQD